jgi:hypothetical protein
MLRIDAILQKWVIPPLLREQLDHLRRFLLREDHELKHELLTIRPKAALIALRSEDKRRDIIAATVNIP